MLSSLAQARAQHKWLGHPSGSETPIRARIHRYDRPMWSLLYLVVRALVRILISARQLGHDDGAKDLEPSSMPSGSRTTSSGRIGRSAARRPARRTGRHSGHCPRAWLHPATSACATTPPTRRVPSPCAGPVACITSGSVPPTPVGGSCPSSMRPRSRSSPSTPASSSRSIGSRPTKGTGATHDETPADGRGPRRQKDHSDPDVPTHVTHMSRLVTMVGARVVGARVSERECGRGERS